MANLGCIPSRTRRAVRSAEQVAYLRAAAANERSERARNPDGMAKHFLSLHYRLRTRPAWLVRRIAERISPGGYCWHIARTRHIDALLLDAIGGGIEQLVILGAGYDSRPYRFRERLFGIRVFEVDFPDNQARKMRRLAAVFGSVPGNVGFVPIDFNRQPLEQVLSEGGYDPDKRTLFIWEGVSYYLNERAVDDVLRFVTRSSPLGSRLIFDYATAAFVNGDLRAYGAVKAAAYLRKGTEPMVFGIAENALPLFLGDRGLRLLSDLGPAELEREYLAIENGSMLGRVYGFLRIALAEVPAAAARHADG